MHFLPASWSLDVTGLPRTCLDCLAIIQYLARDYRDLLWNDETYLQRVDAAVASAGPLLNSLKHEYESKGTSQGA